MSAFQKKVLQAIKDNPGIVANDLARIIIPVDSKMWRKTYNTGRNGACRGKGAWLWMGSYVCKLEKKKLVRRQSYEHFWRFEITNKGEEVLCTE